MTILKSNTKKAQGFIRSYNHYKNKNHANSLYDIYKSFSREKEKAFDRCKMLKSSLLGFNACLCGHNCDTFVYAFLFKHGCVTYLAYITKDNDYMIEYERE